MNGLKKQAAWVAAIVLGFGISAAANATAIPSGWTCTGSCGVSGADGDVTAPPNGKTSYQWISTNDGNNGVGALPSGTLGQETVGSTLATSIFSANAGTDLNFYFNFVTSDGADEQDTYADYAWAALFDASDNLTALLFTARTEPDGSIVPGQGMPAVHNDVTLNPTSVPIIDGAPIWSPLGEDSETCYQDGCGYTGWVNANYTIADAGDYYLKIGVTNWIDDQYDTGLAMSGLTVGGVDVNPTDVPAPTALGLFGLGLLFIGVASTRRRTTHTRQQAC